MMVMGRPWRGGEDGAGNGAGHGRTLPGRYACPDRVRRLIAAPRALAFRGQAARPISLAGDRPRRLARSPARRR